MLRRAQGLHADGKVDEAIAEARRALALAPDYVNALTYLGTTLVTRRLAYQEGLDLLQPAAAPAPGERYQRASWQRRRCIDLNPEVGLKEDAEDLLAAVRQRIE